MTLVTKDYRQYDCKFVNFEPSEESTTVAIVLWDDSTEYEELNNIAYINV